jgi:CelD/BcsL family acetyltransferase involved in cellulose biosynthesis
MQVSGLEHDPSRCHVRILTSTHELGGVAAGWRSLWGRCAGARTPYLSYEWVRTWAEHYVDAGRLHVVVVERQGAVAGIMPLHRIRYAVGPFGIEALETVGRESRNLLALVDPESTDTVVAACAQHLREQLLTRGAVLRLAMVPSDHGLLHLFASRLGSTDTGIAIGFEKSKVAPYVPLPSTKKELEMSLGRRRRKVLARARKRLGRTYGDVRVRWVHGDDVAGAMETMFRLHQRRWSESSIRGLFHEPRSRSFHVAMARECDRLGWLDLSVLELDGTPVSVHFVVVVDRVAYMMRSGRDTSLAEFSIGHVHDLQLFNHYIDAGCKEVDLLRGAEPYKFYWTRDYRRYIECLAVRRGLVRGLSLRAARTWIWLSQFVSHRHPPSEVLAYVRQRRAIRRELRRMGIRLE